MPRGVKRGGEPRYVVIYRELKAGIEAGTYAPGARLPSESELCRAHGVQRDTVRHALELLVREGLIVKQPGRGSFVCGEGDRIRLSIDPAHLSNPILAELIFRLSDEG